jgi:hypothetical protein
MRVGNRRTWECCSSLFLQGQVPHSIRIPPVGEGTAGTCTAGTERSSWAWRAKKELELRVFVLTEWWTQTWISLSGLCFYCRDDSLRIRRSTVTWEDLCPVVTSLFSVSLWEALCTHLLWEVTAHASLALHGPEKDRAPCAIPCGWIDYHL